MTQGHGNWAVPKIKVWISRVGKAALRERINE